MHARMLLFVTGLIVAGSASAYQGPKAEYSADLNMETADGAMVGKVYSAKDKERREYVTDGEKSIMVMRKDKKVTWMLQPEEKMYMEMKGSKEGSKDNISDWKIEQTKVGSETVNGVSTTKSKIIMTGPKGEKMGGFWWLSKDDILVKMDAISVDKGKKDRFMIELKNLKVGKQDASLFEIPAGWSKMSMGQMMMGGGDKNSDDKPATKSKGSEGGFGLKDAIKLLK